MRDPFLVFYFFDFFADFLRATLAANAAASKSSCVPDDDGVSDDDAGLGRRATGRRAN